MDDFALFLGYAFLICTTMIAVGCLWILGLKLLWRAERDQRKWLWLLKAIREKKAKEHDNESG